MNSRIITIAATLDAIREEMAAAAERNQRGDLTWRQAQRAFIETERQAARLRRLMAKAA